MGFLCCAAHAQQGLLLVDVGLYCCLDSLSHLLCCSLAEKFRTQCMCGGGGQLNQNPC